MFPFRTSSIFRSRWIALAWAGSVTWTALSLIPQEQQPAVGADAGHDDADKAADADAQRRQAEAVLRKLGY